VRVPRPVPELSPLSIALPWTASDETE
jgi:hypothetical protein